MAAGFPPETLWDQTPRTHAAIMEGKRQAFEAEIERDMALAWHVANFGRAGNQCQPLAYYLNRAKPRKPQTADEVAAIFEGFAARGLARITEKERDGG